MYEYEMERERIASISYPSEMHQQQQSQRKDLYTLIKSENISLLHAHNSFAYLPAIIHTPSRFILDGMALSTHFTSHEKKASKQLSVHVHRCEEEIEEFH